jgi:signal transduction histidine kinase
VSDVRGDLFPADDRLRLQEPELRQLLDVGRTLVAELDLDTVLRRLLTTARDLTGARYAAVGVLDDDKKGLARFVFVGIDEEQRREIGPLPRGHGVLGELIRDPEPLKLHDVTEHPRSYGFPPGHPVMRTFLGVPIRVRGEVFGNLYLTDKGGGGDFDDRDLESVIVLADWAAIAVGNARLYSEAEGRRAELERAVRGLEATATVARAVGVETDLDRVLELVAKRGRALIAARGLVVVLEQDGEARVVAGVGEVGDEVIGRTLDEGGTAYTSSLAGGATERIADLGASVGHGLSGLGVTANSAIVVPLGFRAHAHGLLIAFDRLDRGPEFDADDEHVLGSFAASAAIAIATAQSVETDRLRDTIEASEQERRRWARELHDETLQELGALKVMLQSAERTEPSDALADLRRRAMEQIDLSIRGLQSLITELRPAALDELGLGPALETLFSRTAATSGLEVAASVSLAFDEGRAASRLSPPVESTTYRLIQESLTNVVKHARAERVEVDVRENADWVTIAVRDDGAGFDTAVRREGFGLVGMRERVLLVGGELDVRSEPGSGTAIEARVPAKHQRTDAPRTAAF